MWNGLVIGGDWQYKKFLFCVCVMHIKCFLMLCLSLLVWDAWPRALALGGFPKLQGWTEWKHTVCMSTSNAGALLGVGAQGSGGRAFILADSRWSKSYVKDSAAQKQGEKSLLFTYTHTSDQLRCPVCSAIANTQTGNANIDSEVRAACLEN